MSKSVRSISTNHPRESVTRSTYRVSTESDQKHVSFEAFSQNARMSGVSSSAAMKQLHAALLKKGRNSTLMLTQLRKVYEHRVHSQQSERLETSTSRAHVNVRDLSMAEPEVLQTEVKNLEQKLNVVNNCDDRWTNVQLSPRFYKNTRQMEQNLSKFIQLEKHLEHHLYISEEHELIVDGIDGQIMFVKCDVKGKSYPIHMRFHRSNCNIDVYYSSTALQPSRRNYERHFIVTGDQVIKITSKPSSVNEYVYFGLHFHLNLRVPIFCWFDKPKVQRQSERQILETKQLIEDFEARTGLKMGLRGQRSHKPETHSFAEIFEVMETRRQKLKEMLAAQNFIQHNKDYAFTYRERSIESSQVRIKTLADKSLSARKRHDLYEDEQHIYNLACFLKKHGKDRTAKPKNKNIGEFQVLWIKFLMFCKTIKQLHQILTNSRYNSHNYDSGVSKITPFMHYKINMRFAGGSVDDRSRIDVNRSLLMYAKFIKRRTKRSAKNAVTFFLKELAQQKISIHFQKKSIYFHSKVLMIQKFFKRSIRFDLDSIHMMINAVVADLKRENGDFPVTTDSRVYYTKYLNKQLIDSIAFSYLSELMHRFKHSFHQYYINRENVELEALLTEQKPKLDITTLVKRLKEQIQREQLLSQIKRKSITAQQNGPAVKTQDDLITERLERKRQTLMMMPFLTAQSTKPRSAAPSLKLFSRKDFLRELVITKLDFLMKTRK